MVLNHVSTRNSTITGRVYVQYGFDREKREVLEAWAECLQEIVRQGVHPSGSADNPEYLDRIGVSADTASTAPSP
jgi:hypothetical protein